MDEFEKVNEALENEDIETLAASEDSEPIVENEVAETEVSDETKVKDEILEETENFEVADEASETEAEDVSEAEAEDVSEAEGKDVSEAGRETEVPKKKFILEKTIIKAACVLLVTLVVFGCAVLVKNIMTPSIEGVWRLDKVYMKGSEKDARKMGTSAKEAVYYHFKSDGNFIFTSGTITQKMKWSYADAKGKAADKATEQIIVYPKDNQAYATQFKWSCEGNALSDKKLTLKTGTDTVQINKFSSYNGSEIPEYKMKADKSFKAVNDVLGSWKDKTNNQQITLNKDGSYILEVGGYLIQTGNYKIDTKKKTIALGYVGDGKDGDTGALPYGIKDNKLTLANYEFTKTK